MTTREPPPGLLMTRLPEERPVMREDETGSSISVESSPSAEYQEDSPGVNIGGQEKEQQVHSHHGPDDKPDEQEETKARMSIRMRLMLRG